MHEYNHDNGSTGLNYPQPGSNTLSWTDLSIVIVFIQYDLYLALYYALVEVVLQLAHLMI
jgi:hypothetical protein